MRIAISDYDGTLFQNNSVSQDDIGAILKWRKAGNVFGIATGRDLSLLLYETERWGIPFDFLVCLNGAALYSANLQILKSRNIPSSLIKEVLTHPSAALSMHYQLSVNGINKIYIRDDRSFFRNNEVDFRELTYEEVFMETDIQQITLAYTSKHLYDSNSKALSTTFKDKLSLNINGCFVDINQLGVNKLAGIQDILKIMGWKSNDVFTIGDGENDISMIQYYGGYAISNASPKVIRASNNVYRHVSEMIIDKL